MGPGTYSFAFFVDEWAARARDELAPSFRMGRVSPVFLFAPCGSSSCIWHPFAFFVMSEPPDPMS